MRILEKSQRPWSAIRFNHGRVHDLDVPSMRLRIPRFRVRSDGRRKSSIQAGETPALDFPSAVERATTPMSKIIPCPKCGESSRVLYVRERQDGSVYRRRSCEECDLQFGSEERIVGGPNITFSGVNVTALVEALESCGIPIDTTKLRQQNQTNH